MLNVQEEFHFDNNETRHEEITFKKKLLITAKKNIMDQVPFSSNKTLISYLVLLS